MSAGRASFLAQAAMAVRRFAPVPVAFPLLFSTLFFAITANAAGRHSFLHPLGPVASAERSLFFDVILCMMIVVVPVLVLVPLFAWRYRRTRKAAAYEPRWEFSWPIEILVWGIPVVVVVILSWMIVAREIPIGPYKAVAAETPPLRIEVIGLDWKWLFIYPDEGIATVGALAIPTGRPVEFDLTSDTVMQSFFIPALGSQIYAMAGMVTKLNLLADRPGEADGRNTQYNGSFFHQQRFTVHAMSPADFRQWIDKVRTDGIALSPRTYETLREKGTFGDARDRLATAGMPDGRLDFRSVPARFFAGVVAKYNAGAKPIDRTPAAVN